MRHYHKLVSTIPPEGLLAFASKHLDTEGLVYECFWAQDTSPDGVLVKSKKYRAVMVSCSECGQSTEMQYAPPERAYCGGNPVYGFFAPVCQGVEAVRHGDNALCPRCGAPVKVMLASRIGHGEEVTAEANVMSASLLPGEHGKRPLVLTGWNIRRLVNRNGRGRYAIRPWEAYVFEEKSAAKLVWWKKAYGGTAGYFHVWDAKPRQPVDWHETWGQDKAVFGLTAELVEASCLHNSKFDQYMRPEWRSAWKSPVPYLRLYQIYPQVENLVVQGCAHILDSLLTKALRGGWRDSNCRGFPVLHDIDWQQTRPAQMLGLTKAEFQLMKEQCWDTYHWEIFVKAKAVGDRMTQDDIESLHQYGGEDVERIIGRAPVGKTMRYLLKQYMELAAANDPYNEYDDVYVDDEFTGAEYLADYWDMAREAGWDLTAPEIKWPKNLLQAHDRAMAARDAKKNEALRSNFAERFQFLGKWAYASGELMILPAANQAQLTREGKRLNHCVSGYGKSHAIGKTAIFFIRQVADPYKPFYTLELDEQKLEVRQNRGKGNCARTPEVTTFEHEWIAWVRRGAPRLKNGTPVGAKSVLPEAPGRTEHREEQKTA